jgi:Tol biopolymer transport system component
VKRVLSLVLMVGALLVGSLNVTDAQPPADGATSNGTEYKNGGALRQYINNYAELVGYLVLDTPGSVDDLSIVLGQLGVSVYGFNGHTNELAPGVMAPESSGELLFTRTINGEAGGEGVYVINADGTDESLLFSFDEIDMPYTDTTFGSFRCAAWSPDGSQVAFDAADESANFIAVVNRDGSNPRRVAIAPDPTDTNVLFHHPEWVPNSNRISFGFTEYNKTSGVVVAQGIKVVDLTSSDVTTIRDDLMVNAPDGSQTYWNQFLTYATLSHSWSPDGSQIAVGSLNYGVLVMNADGSDLQVLNIDESAEYDFDYIGSSVAWSPDGSEIVSGLYRLAAYDPVTGIERELMPFGATLNERTHESVSWSPDGSQLAIETAWMSLANGNLQSWYTLSIMDAQSGEIREILRTPEYSAGQPITSIACVDWLPAT